MRPALLAKMGIAAGACGIVGYTCLPWLWLLPVWVGIGTGIALMPDEYFWGEG